jgi:hypothetical protein
MNILQTIAGFTAAVATTTRMLVYFSMKKNGFATIEIPLDILAHKMILFGHKAFTML